jgi:ferritin-like metal-binding protein YciE
MTARKSRNIRDDPVAEFMRRTDGLPNERAALPPGSLPGVFDQPQGDEHRDTCPPTIPLDPDLATALTQEGPEMSSTTTKARDIFIVGLRNQHAVENQAIELLERQIGRLENYPEMVERMRQHLAESKEQARRIEDLLSGLGTSHSALKDTGLALFGNMMALGHTVAPDEVIKNTFANYAFEHYEIAGYLSLLTLADAIGQTSAKNALNQSLREEESMAQWIADHIGPTMLRYVERAEAGQTAGV